MNNKSTNCKDNGTVCGIQARMGSTRLPGKVIKILCGKPMISHIILRIQKCREINKIYLLTSEDSANDVLENIALNHEIGVIRGKEDDVLSRYFKLLELEKPSIVVRICADNPILDCVEIDRIVKYHKDNMPDYSFNSVPYMDNGYPDGIGAEVLTASALVGLKNRKLTNEQRRHVTKYIWDNKELYDFRYIKAPSEFYGTIYKLDVDTLKDFRMVKRIFDKLYRKNPYFGIRDIMEVM